MPPVNNATNVDYSIVLEVARNYQMLLDPPEIEYPLREVVQRSESSGLPDGSEFIEGAAAPVGEPFDKAMARISREANAAWKEWVDSANEPKLSMTGEMEAPLGQSIEDAMLTEAEQLELLRVTRLMAVEDITFQRRETAAISRLLQECTGLITELTEEELTNRYYDNVEVTRDEFGATKRKVTRVDRCAGKADVEKVKGVQVSDIAQARFNPSQKDRMDNIIMSAFQTEKWRKPSRAEESNYIPNISPLDDPDFITPSDMSSRNFSIYPPASRPYNITFKVWMADGSIRRLRPKTKNGKDYTALTSIKYMLDQKKVKYTHVEIDEVTQTKTRSYPSCKFEIDIRVTYGESLQPDPHVYKKVDPDTRLGKKLLQLLNEQPYLFNEHVWEYEDVDEAGNKQTTKKVAVGFAVPSPKDSVGPRVYWVYLDENANSTGIPAFLRTKRVLPQYHYQHMSYYKRSDPNYLKKDQPFLASVRVSKNYSYYDRRSKRHVNFDEVEDCFISYLAGKGYILYNTGPESEFNSVLLYKFIHKDTKTREQRKALFSKLTNN
tara:strand:- start:4240 stop:5889 length:1650 start_codon:yes stop_codon:yes gene_type:complete